MRGLWSSWRARRVGGFASPAADWQKRLLTIFLLAYLVVAVAVAIINGVQWILAPGPVWAWYTGGDLVASAVIAGLWALARTGRVRLVAVLFLALQVVAGSLLFPLNALDRVLILYALPTFMGSFLISPGSSFLFAGFSILAYTGAYFLGGRVVSYNYVAVPLLVLVALVAWAIARQLEQAMHTVRQEMAAHKKAEEEVRRQAEALAALHETALDLTAQGTLPALLQAIVARAAGLLGAKGGSIFLLRPASDDLECAAIHNGPSSYVGTVLRRNEGLCGRVLESGQSLAVSDYDHWEGRSPQYGGQDEGASVAVPIVWGEGFLGVLELDSTAGRTFSPEDIALLERFAPLAAAALENHRLLQDLQRRLEELHSTQSQLIQAAKMAAVGTLAAGVAHEINNPMTIVLGFSEVLLEDLPPDSPQRRDLEKVVTEARRVNRVVQALLALSRQAKPERRPADVNQVLEQTLALSRRYLEDNGVTIAVDYAPDLGPISLDETQMRQVFLNLIDNAVEAMPQGGQMRIRTARVGTEVAVAIADSGPGIPGDVREHLFDLFCTKPGGAGLGLPVSLGIVREHDGRITVESTEGQGSTFTIWLPETVAVPRSAAP